MTCCARGWSNGPFDDRSDAPCPTSHINDYPADILARAAQIRLACFDVDGTLTDGRLLFDSDGRELKAFHVHDGQGLVLLRKVGIAVAFVTARASAIAERRAAELGADAHANVKDKLACVREHRRSAWASAWTRSPSWATTCRPAVMPRACGLAVAPANAHPWVRERVHWRTSARGGEGAARELCDLLLAAQGHAEALLA